MKWTLELLAGRGWLFLGDDFYPLAAVACESYCVRLEGAFPASIGSKRLEQLEGEQGWAMVEGNFAPSTLVVVSREWRRVFEGAIILGCEKAIPRGPFLHPHPECESKP